MDEEERFEDDESVRPPPPRAKEENQGREGKDRGEEKAQPRTDGRVANGHNPPNAQRGEDRKEREKAPGSTDPEPREADFRGILTKLLEGDC